VKVSRLLGLVLALLLLAAASGCQSAPRTPAASLAVDPGPLTVADVQGVLASMAAAPGASSDFKVDVAAFASSVIGQLPVYVDKADPSVGPTTFHEPEGTTQRQMTPSEASSTVGQALAVYRRIERAQGAAAADSAMNSAGRGDTQGSLSAGDRNLLALLQEGAGRLTFMFGEPDPKAWTWKVTKVAVVGTDTADVTYAVAVPAAKPFKFTRPSHTKRLHFGRRVDGTWVLDGWLDYLRFESGVKGSIKPSDEIPNLVPNWWDTLGAE
jgi:hypothetical protein